MRQQKPLRSRFFVAIALLAVLGVACIRPPNRVGLKPLTADIIFGIPPVDEPVAPPDTFPDTRASTVAPDIPDFAGRDIGEGFRFNTACPEATVNEVEREATTRLVGRPAVGNYKWKMDGVQEILGVGRFNVQDIGRRQIKDVQNSGTSDQDFVFTVVQRDRTLGVPVATTYEVIQSTPGPGEGLPPPPAGGGIVYDQGTLNGIYLKKIVYDPDGDSSVANQEFNANPPILFFPLPANPGLTRSTTSTDQRSFDTLTHTITVKERRRYDACGEMVDGWYVSAEQTFTAGSRGRDTNPANTESTQRRFNYAVALQYGGMFIFDHVEAPCPTYNEEQEKCVPDAQNIFKSRIGQLAPDPLT